MIISYFPKPTNLDKIWVILFVFLFSPTVIFGQTRTYTTSTTFTVPAGVGSIVVECWGAGGGGSNRTGAAGGGGGGAYTRGTITGLTPGSPLTVTVGTGAAGTNGSASSVGAISANGGISVNNSRNGGAGGAASAVGGNVLASYSGGSGGNARANTAGPTNEGGGGGGGSATTTANGGVGGNATATGGTGGTGYGPGGNGADGDGVPDAATGTVPGGGGGGRGEGGGTSKAGANGQVIISWTPPVFLSQGSVDPNVFSNWKTSGGYSPTSFLDDYQTFVVQNGHNMTTSGSGWTVSGISTMVEIQSGGTLTETTAISFSGNTTFQVDNGGTLNHNVNSISVFGGTDSFGNTSTVNYGFAGNQSVLNATYGNLTISGSGSKSLSGAITTLNLSIQGSAVLASDIYSITGNAAGTFTMAAGTGLTLGNTGNATAIAFPTSFTTANISLNNSSTVTYQTDGGQTVSGTPVYGNLEIAGSGTKSLSSAISINGDLTVSGSATLADATFLITGAAGKTFTLGSGTTYTSTKTTNPCFPANMIYAFNTSSTVNINGTGSFTFTSFPASLGNLSFGAGAASVKTLPAANPVTINGNLTINASNTLTDNGNTITVKGNIANNGTHSGVGKILLNSGAGTHTITGGTSAFGNLELDDSNGATITGTGTTTISGAFSVIQGNFTLNSFTTALAVNGITTVGNGATTGTVTIANSTGTRTFTGLVTVGANGTWNNSANATVTFRGGITNNGIFTAGSGIQTFDTNPQSLTGTFSIPRTTVNGVTLFNNNSLTVNTALAGTGGLTQAANSTLNIAFTGTIGITTLTATASGNEVNYTYAGTQTVKAINYNDLILSTSGAKTFGVSISISGNLTINGTASASLASGTTSSASTLTLGAAGQPSGSFGGTASSATYKNATYFAGVVTGILNVSVSSCSAGSWIGGTSTNWNTASNWCSGTVPTAATNVLIYPGGNQPVIGTAAYCNNITVNPGATLTITGSNLLTVSGDWINGGNFTANTSTAIFNGSAQSIGNTAFYNITLSGSGIKTLTGTTVNGILSMEGSATTAGTAPTFGAGATLQYSGSVVQTTGIELPSTFNGSGGLIFNNASGLLLSGNTTVTSALTLTLGNVNTGTFILALSNGVASSLTRVSGTITGRLRRTISTTLSNDYLFPLGTTTFYRPAILNFSSLAAGTNITAEFIENPPAGFTGYLDGVDNLNNIFTEGYWRFISSGIPAANYTLTLTGNGFTSYAINEATRITGRDNGNSTWRAMGIHASQSGNDISRTGITNLNTTSFDYALATGCLPTSMSYGYERNITIDNTKVAGGSDLYNFPVLINLTGQNYLKNAPTGQIINVNGFDIIFTDENYNKLDHQLEYYNGTNGDLIAWVRIPILTTSSPTVIKILYGNQQVTTDPSVTTVWDSHFKGVWHLDNNSLNDFTSFNKSGTPNNSPTYPAGRIYNSLGLNSTNQQYVEVLNDPAINFAGNITVSAWVNMNLGGRDQKIAGNQNNSSGGYKFGIYTNNKVEFEIRNAANTPSLNRDVAGGTVLSTGQWYYLAGISSDVLDSIKTFVNGMPERPFKKTGILGIAANTLTISKEPFLSDYYFNGSFDEIRISDEVRSNGWMRTEYNNQFSPSTFYSVDAVAVIANNLPASSICNGPITLTFGYPAGGTYSGNPNIVGDVFTPPSAGTYTIIYTYVSSCGPTSITKDYIITDSPPAPIAPNKEYCSNQITYLEATTGENIRWYLGGTLVSTANPFSTGKTLPGTYTYTVTQSVNDCESSPTTVTLTIFNGITINTQPQPVTICSGSNAVFSVVSAGYNLTYRWQENGVNISNGGIYSGATSASLTLTNPGTALNGRTYRCVVSSSCGPTTLNSSSALLTVNPLPVATFSYTGTPYCPNAANPSASFSGGGIAGTFSSTSGLVFVSASTGQVNIAASTPGNYTVTNTIAATGGCTEVIATSPFAITSNLIWTGAVSTNWNIAGNWTCGFIPNSSISVQIPNAPNQPVLSTGSTGTVMNLVIDNGSSLTVSGNTLRIAGTITNNGTMTSTDGTVELNGITGQSIGTNIFAGNTIKNLIVNNSAGVTLSGPLGVSGIVTVQNGNLSSAGNLTLLSTALQTALVDGSGTGEITGNVTMQRYLPSGFGYKYFSSPFTAATVSEFTDESITLLYRYDENRMVSGTPATGWVNYKVPANILNPLAGYAVNFGSSALPITVDVTGLVTNGDKSVTLYNHNQSYTQGLNLIGNPYPSPIDWNAAGWTKLNIDNALYFFKASTMDQYGGSYRSYINGFSSDGIVNNIIPSMQGFFVHVSIGSFPVTGTLSMNNSVRSTNLNHAFTKSGTDSYLKFLRLGASFSDDTASLDPMVIYFDEKATPGFESDLDALKLLNTDLKIPNLWGAATDGKRLSISALPVITEDSCTIPLGLKLNRAGNIIFRLQDVNSSFAGMKIFIDDLTAGIHKELLPGQEYLVPLDIGEYNNRFFLNMMNLSTGNNDITDNDDKFIIYCSEGVLKAEIGILNGTSGMLRVFNLTGQLMFIEKVYSTGHHEYNTHFVDGIYIVTYSTGTYNRSKKLFIQNR